MTSPIAREPFALADPRNMVFEQKNHCLSRDECGSFGWQPAGCGFIIPSGSVDSSVILDQPVLNREARAS
jgi:hypothetical protein